MKWDKLFDIERYERGVFLGCSVLDCHVEQQNFTHQQYMDVPLFTENQQCVPFCAKREEKSDTRETDELILLQLSYW